MTARPSTPGTRGRGLLAALLLLLAPLPAGLVLLHLRRASESEAESRVIEEQRRLEAKRSQRTEEWLARARELLLAAIDDHLVPGRDEASAALALYERAAAVSRGEPRAQAGRGTARGLALFLDGDWASSEVALKAEQAGPEETISSYFLGYLQLRRGQPLEAWGSFGVALKGRPDWLAASIGQAWANLAMEDTGKALPVLARALERWPTSPQLAVGYARCLALEVKAEESRQWYARAFELGARSDEVIGHFVAERQARGGAPAARADLEQLIQEDPARPAPHVHLARVLTELKQPEAAAAEYQTALSLNPDDLRSRVELASLLLDRREPHLAVPLLEEAQRLAPEDPEVLLYAGYAYKGVDDDGAAILRFTRSCGLGLDVGCWEACVMGREESCRQLSAKDYAFARSLRAEGAGGRSTSRSSGRSYSGSNAYSSHYERSRRQVFVVGSSSAGSGHRSSRYEADLPFEFDGR